MRQIRSIMGRFKRNTLMTQELFVLLQAKWQCSKTLASTLVMCASWRPALTFCACHILSMWWCSQRRANVPTQTNALGRIWMVICLRCFRKLLGMKQIIWLICIINQPPPLCATSMLVAPCPHYWSVAFVCDSCNPSTLKNAQLYASVQLFVAPLTNVFAFE